MNFTPHGKHLIAGEWVASEVTFRSEPAHGPAHDFSAGTAALVNRACEAAEEAFWSFGYSSRTSRAAFLDSIADEIEARTAAIINICSRETGLPKERIDGELGRTTGQLRLFANHIRKGTYLDRQNDPALPERKPQPRPNLKLVERPIGPVAVFGASNFPLAFSTAGGDTAAALAAGCPVVVKGHSAHPGTGEIIADAILEASLKCGVHSGVFSLIQGGTRNVGTALVQNPSIKAVGFTGSLAGGRALFDLCMQRSEPIPFFGELGSVNPMFFLPGALSTRAETLGQGWAASLTIGAGQFCTNPGIAVVIDSPDADRLVMTTRENLKKVSPQVMLTEGIAQAYRSGQARLKARNTVKPIYETVSELREASPNLYETTGRQFLADKGLSEEVFGPLALIVRVSSLNEMRKIAREFEGQLTATIHIDDSDNDAAQSLVTILERKAGRIVINGFPTGVEVCDAMVHGGPYPASTNFGATSVGTLSIRRFLRPVCYQNVPKTLSLGYLD